MNSQQQKVLAVMSFSVRTNICRETLSIVLVFKTFTSDLAKDILLIFYFDGILKIQGL